MNNSNRVRASWLRGRQGIVRYWWLVFCFVGFFLIGGAVGWLRLLAERDIGSQGLQGDENTKEMQAFRREEPQRFVDFGLKTGAAGTAVVFGIHLLARKTRKSHG